MLESAREVLNADQKETNAEVKPNSVVLENIS